MSGISTAKTVANSGNAVGDSADVVGGLMVKGAGALAGDPGLTEAGGSMADAGARQYVANDDARWAAGAVANQVVDRIAGAVGEHFEGQPGASQSAEAAAHQVLEPITQGGEPAGGPNGGPDAGQSGGDGSEHTLRAEIHVRRQIDPQP